VTDDPSPEAAPRLGVPTTAPAPSAEDQRPPEPRRPEPRPTTRAVQYKGADLDAERGPGLGCFWIQIVALVVLVILTPVSVSLGWPSEVSAVLLFATIGLLLFAGQTIIFLLRLVAADRRGRRRPLASGTKTVGELEDERAARSTASGVASPPAGAGPDDRDDVRQ